VSDLIPPTPGQTAWNAVADGAADAIPVVGPILRRCLQDTLARQQAATGQVIERVAAEVGYQLFERTLREDPRLRSLFIDSMEAAFRTGLEAKRWLFGALVRDAILDESLFESSWLMSQALSEVDAPHIVALEKLRRVDQQMEADLTAPEEDHRSMQSEETAGPRDWSDILRAEWTALPAPIRATLVRTGLVTDSISPPEPYSGPIKRLTEFGVDLLDKLPASITSPAGPRARAHDWPSPQ
jgi:hypothetical protein